MNNDYTLLPIYILVFLPLLLGLAFGCGGRPADYSDKGVCSVRYIDSIAIDEPERALAILDSAEQHELMSSDFDISRLRCLVYHNGLSDYNKALRYGTKAYDMPEAHDCAEEFLRLIELIADENYQTGNYTESVRLCTEGLQLARDSLVKVSEANLNVTLAVNLLDLDRPDEAFSHYREGVDILDK